MSTPDPTATPSGYALALAPDGTSWNARENLHDILRRELLGPADGDDEVLQMSPDARYLVGRIAPAKLSGDRREAPIVEDADDPESTVDLGDDEDAAQGRGLPVESVDDTSIEADEDGGEDAPVRRGLMIPASMGLRFQVPLDVGHVVVRASWGTYEPESGGEPDPRTGRTPRVFRRRRHDHRIDVPVATIPPGRTWEHTVEQLAGAGAVRLKVDVALDEHPDHPDRSRRIVEVALCNDRECERKIPVNAWMFQTELVVEARDGSSEIFLPVHDVVLDPPRRTEDEELRHLELQYRDRLEFAIGRTCSATWLPKNVSPSRRASRVATTWLPTSETPQVRAADPDGAVLDMRTLADLAGGSPAPLIDALRPIVDGYRGWLDEQRERLSALPSHLQGTATDAAEQADYVLAQLDEGLQTLADDADARRCFAFMNRVMADQRDRSQVAASRASNPDLDADAEARRLAGESKAHSWRTFQIAFVLMQVTALSGPDAPRRSADNLARVELLFFPTGGGKTEAYLGLAAYAFAARRLQGVVDTPDGRLDGNDGVAVLMRYTLRLLTAQQFQRATTLICAAELERQADPTTWGTTPFRIGLWVGTGVSPKWIKDAAEELAEAKKNRSSRLTTLQVQRCPWCGRQITADDIRIDTDAGRVFTYCSDDLAECPFSLGGSAGEGLPVLTVDEEIYRLVPAFLIATVDKFARLAREGQAASLLGYVGLRCARHGYTHPDDSGCNPKIGGRHNATAALSAATVTACGRLRPPDLVIQDELHLITGALGTTVGLFECGIDVLTQWRTAEGRPVRPLVVASTATVRNAHEQSKSLYGRDPLLFPPRVLDASDTFFSSEVPVTPDRPGRRYVGVSTTGVRLTTAEIRVAEVLMAGAQELLDRCGVAADPYMTLVGYFNATRELAGMSRYVQDDVQTALAKGRRGVPLPRRVGTDYGDLNLDELTSRVSGADITETLDRMTIAFDPTFDSTLARASRREATDPPTKRGSQPPYDVVLATSMLQVGVDVTRLGLMMLVGQPKNTAEYIQASSRVGRDPSRPGLVVTLGNWARPRDLAHFEQFQAYHESFYARVEPLSVTPFSVTSLQRGLDGLLVSTLRVLDAPSAESLSPDAGAARITARREIADRLVSALVARATAAATDPDTADRVRIGLTQRLDTWEKYRQTLLGKRLNLVYDRDSGTGKARLVRDAESVKSRADAATGAPFIVANSMREVQPEINLLVSPKPENLYWTEPQDAPRWTPQPAATGDDA